MATSHKTPGVYIEEVSTLPPSIAPEETAIPAFIGYTEKATEHVDGDLTNVPKRISSLVDFELHFGRAQPETAVNVAITEQQDSAGNTTSISTTVALAETTRSLHILYYCMQMYFANGGGPCWVVSVGGFKTPVATALVQSELAVGLGALVNEDEPTLIVCPEAQNLSSIADYKALMDAALAQCAQLRNRFTIMDLHGGDQSMNEPGANLTTAVNSFRSDGIGTNALMHGAAYAPNIKTTLDFTVDEASTVVTHTTTGTAASAITLDALKSSDDSRYQLSIAAIRDQPMNLPPSTAVAGIYSRVDSSRGVWQAPANLSLNGVVAPTIKISNVENDHMNVDSTTGKSVNAIRSFSGKGTLVWGARTLAGNDNEWRYVNVRRFFNFVEESAKKATEQFVFEPNDASTWVKVQAMIENFLTSQWRRGALQGVKTEHAFYVSVGLGKTMSAADIREGRMIVEIGMAVVRPAEFIILRLSHMMAKS